MYSLTAYFLIWLSWYGSRMKTKYFSAFEFEVLQGFFFTTSMNPFAILPHMSCYTMKKFHSQDSFRFIQSFSATESLEYLDLDRSPLKQLSITQNNSHLRGVKNTDDLRISLVEIKFINSRCWRPLYFGQNNQNLVIDSWPKTPFG